MQLEEMSREGWRDRERRNREQEKWLNPDYLPTKARKDQPPELDLPGPP